MSFNHAASVDCADLLTAPIGLRAALGDEFLSLFAAKGRKEIFSPGAGLAEDAAPQPRIVCIHSGTVKVTSILLDGRQQIIDFLTKGDLLVPARSEESGQRVAIAITPVESFTLSSDEFLRVISNNPELRRDLLDRLFGAIERKSRQIVALGRKRSDERVASFLLDLGMQRAALSLSDGALRLPMYRSEIADYLGLTTETVSRVFSALRDEGLIRLTAPN